MRLIDADALLERVPKARLDGEKIDRDGAIADTVMLICNAPTIDAVEVTRCKDCKYFSTDNPTTDTFGECEKYSTPHTAYDTFYCANAEKGADDDET